MFSGMLATSIEYEYHIPLFGRQFATANIYHTFFIKVAHDNFWIVLHFCMMQIWVFLSWKTIHVANFKTILHLSLTSKNCHSNETRSVPAFRWQIRAWSSVIYSVHQKLLLVSNTHLIIIISWYLSTRNYY